MKDINFLLVKENRIQISDCLCCSSITNNNEKEKEKKHIFLL